MSVNVTQFRPAASSRLSGTSANDEGLASGDQKDDEEREDNRSPQEIVEAAVEAHVENYRRLVAGGTNSAVMVSRPDSPSGGGGGAVRAASRADSSRSAGAVTRPSSGGSGGSDTRPSNADAKRGAKSSSAAIQNPSTITAHPALKNLAATVRLMENYAMGKKGNEDEINDLGGERGGGDDLFQEGSRNTSGRPALTGGLKPRRPLSARDAARKTQDHLRTNRPLSAANSQVGNLPRPASTTTPRHSGTTAAAAESDHQKQPNLHHTAASRKQGYHGHRRYHNNKPDTTSKIIKHPTTTVGGDVVAAAPVSKPAGHILKEEEAEGHGQDILTIGGEDENNQYNLPDHDDPDHHLPPLVPLAEMEEKLQLIAEQFVELVEYQQQHHSTEVERLQLQNAALSKRLGEKETAAALAKAKAEEDRIRREKIQKSGELFIGERSKGIGAMGGHSINLLQEQFDRISQKHDVKLTVLNQQLNRREDIISDLYRKLEAVWLPMGDEENERLNRILKGEGGEISENIDAICEEIDDILARPPIDSSAVSFSAKAARRQSQLEGDRRRSMVPPSSHHQSRLASRTSTSTDGGIPPRLSLLASPRNLGELAMSSSSPIGSPKHPRSGNSSKPGSPRIGGDGSFKKKSSSPHGGGSSAKKKTVSISDSANAKLKSITEGNRGGGEPISDGTIVFRETHAFSTSPTGSSSATSYDENEASGVRLQLTQPSSGNFSMKSDKDTVASPKGGGGKYCEAEMQTDISQNSPTFNAEGGSSPTTAALGLPEKIVRRLTPPLGTIELGLAAVQTDDDVIVSYKSQLPKMITEGTQFDAIQFELFMDQMQNGIGGVPGGGGGLSSVGTAGIMVSQPSNVRSRRASIGPAPAGLGLNMMDGSISPRASGLGVLSKSASGFLMSGSSAFGPNLGQSASYKSNQGTGEGSGGSFLAAPAGGVGGGDMMMGSRKVSSVASTSSKRDSMVNLIDKPSGPPPPHGSSSSGALPPPEHHHHDKSDSKLVTTPTGVVNTPPSLNSKSPLDLELTQIEAAAGAVGEGGGDDHHPITMTPNDDLLKGSDSGAKTPNGGTGKSTSSPSGKKHKTSTGSGAGGGTTPRAATLHRKRRGSVASSAGGGGFTPERLNSPLAPAHASGESPSNDHFETGSNVSAAFSVATTITRGGRKASARRSSAVSLSRRGSSAFMSAGNLPGGSGGASSLSASNVNPAPPTRKIKMKVQEVQCELAEDNRYQILLESELRILQTGFAFKRALGAINSAATNLILFTDGYAEDLICKACDQIYTEPCVLWACGHTFCRRCIEKKMSVRAKKREAERQRLEAYAINGPSSTGRAAAGAPSTEKTTDDHQEQQQQGTEGAQQQQLPPQQQQHRLHNLDDDEDEGVYECSECHGISREGYTPNALVSNLVMRWNFKQRSVQEPVQTVEQLAYLLNSMGQSDPVIAELAVAASASAAATAHNNQLSLAGRGVGYAEEETEEEEQQQSSPPDTARGEENSSPRRKASKAHTSLYKNGHLNLDDHLPGGSRSRGGDNDDDISDEEF